MPKNPRSRPTSPDTAAGPLEMPPPPPTPEVQQIALRDITPSLYQPRRFYIPDAERWFPDDELVTILAALPELKDRRVADAYLLMLASACRPNEAAFVEAEDIIRIGEDRVWRIPEHKSKEGREFLIPLIGPIGEVINRRYLEVGGRGPLFWEYVATKDYPQALGDGNEKLRELTQLVDIRPHDFRRTCRTHLSALGVRTEVAEAVLAHAEGEIKATYNIWTYWPERQQALALWHSKLAELSARAKSLAA